MANPNVLLVPIEVKALVVNTNVRIGQNFQRWTMNYQNLSDFRSAEPPAFSSNATDFAQRPENEGVYLHWTLPRALRHGTYDPATSSAAFPLVPNRWLILRYSGPETGRTATAWIVESDFLDPNAGKSAYIDPFSSTLQVTAIGQKIPLAGWQESGRHPLFLTAVSPLSATFAAYQPYNENVFSIHDPLVGVDRDTLSYLVAGWYSDPTKDPLAAGSDFVETMQQLNWEVANPAGSSARVSIYEGAVWRVQWDRSGSCPISNRPANAAGVEMAVGNSAVDALTALVRKRAKESGSDVNPDLLEAFQYDMLSSLDRPNGEWEEILDNRIHERGFGAHNGGYVWELVDKPDGASSPAPRQPAGEPDWLIYLNQLQSQYDAEARILSGMQWDVYSLWWKQQYAGQLLPGQYPSGMTRRMFEEQMDPANKNGAVFKLYQQYRKVEELSRQIPTGSTQEQLQWAIDSYAKAHGIAPEQELKRLSLPPFWEANNPVVLFSGTRATGLLTDDAPLQCRFADQVVTGFRYTGAQITAASMQGGIPTLPMPCLPAVMPALVTEFFFLDPGNAPMVAAKALKRTDPATAGAVRQAMAAHDSLIGTAPAFDLNDWIQPWSPFFLMWEIFYYPIGYDTEGVNNWRFDGTHYQWTGDGADTHKALVYSGRIFLTPQAGFTLKERLERYMAAHPNPDLKALNDFITRSCDWDFLSQALDGLNQQLALRDPLGNRAPDNEKVLFQPDFTLAKLVGGAADYVPIAGPTKQIPFEGWPPSEFQQWRSGQFYFNRVMIVDRFGQSLDVVNSTTSAQFAPIVAKGLLPVKTVLPQEPDRFVQVPPRLLQPGRLDFEFLSANDNAKVLNLDEDVNPVCAWILPNHLDRSLSIYAPAGAPIGELYVVTNTEQRQVLCWEGTPGGNYDDLADVSRDFPHPGQFLKALTAMPPEAGVNAFQELLGVIDQTLWVIDPLGAREDQNLSVLVGRPLALVRCRLRFELDGPAVADPSWQYTFDPVDPEFPAYPFPVRLGDLAIRQDGLMGYFANDDYSQFEAVCTPEEVPYSLYVRLINDHNWLFLTFDQSRQAYLTMLVDPRAEVHAYTDILPVRSIGIPQRFVNRALANMDVTFRVGPLLTDSDVTAEATEKVILPQPAEQNGKWSWLEWRNGRPEALEVAPASQNALLANIPPKLRTGFLKLSSGLDNQK